MGLHWLALVQMPVAEPPAGAHCADQTDVVPVEHWP